MHLIMFICHVPFLISDIYVFGFEISAVVFDVVFLWLNFYNYMTLNKITVCIQVGLYGLAALMATSHIKRVFIDTEAWTPCLVFFF